MLLRFRKVSSALQSGRKKGHKWNDKMFGLADHFFAGAGTAWNLPRIESGGLAFQASGVAAGVTLFSLRPGQLNILQPFAKN